VVRRAVVPAPSDPEVLVSSDSEVPVRPTAPDSWWERVQRWRSDPRAGAAVLVLVAIAGVVVWLRASTGPSPSPAAASQRTSQVTTTGTRSATTRTSTASLLVHVVGAVRASGVVELSPGARVRDAVAAAGGPADDADLQQMNLAAPVADGQRIAVPRIGEAAPPLAAASTPPGAAPSGSLPAGPLNLNSATATELEALPGIGPTLADAIVREREKLGGFKQIDDLKQVRGIGDARFADIRDLVTV
jgi:competence protein ComEA